MVRKYNLGRRGEAAEETRRRIVDATFALHSEQGVAATTMKDIAERADVSVGTVYHHFPTYDDAIQACGEHAIAFAPPPGPDLFAYLHRLDASQAHTIAVMPIPEVGIGTAINDRLRRAAAPRP